MSWYRNSSIIGFLFGLFLAGCTSCSTPVLLTPQQVLRSTEPEEATTIATLELQLRQARQAIALLIKNDQIEEKAAKSIVDGTRAVDYYICKAWVAMVEGDIKMRDEATLMAQAGFDVLVKKLLKAIDAIEPTGDKT